MRVLCLSPTVPPTVVRKLTAEPLGRLGRLLGDGSNMEEVENEADRSVTEEERDLQVGGFKGWTDGWRVSYNGLHFKLHTDESSPSDQKSTTLRPVTH